MTLEWHDQYGRGNNWTARNDRAPGWAASYAICTMENGEYRVWGLMREDRFVDTLEEAQAIAEDDYRRRRRVNDWREYMETHDAPNEPVVESVQLNPAIIQLDVSNWTRMTEVQEYARHQNIDVQDAIRIMVNAGVSHYQGTPLTVRKP